MEKGKIEGEPRPREATADRRSALLLWAAGFTAIFTMHVCWSLLDRNPPAWDMALHQELGWRVVRAWQQGTLWSGFANLSPYYPPLYYLQEAAVIALGAGGRLLAVASNLAGLALLSFSTFRLGSLWLDEMRAVAAGWLALLFPMVVWTSRESLLDVALAGWVALALYLVARRNLDESGWRAVPLGLVLAAGQLTKWTFPVFVAAPIGWALWRSSDRTQSLRNVLTAVLVATPLVFWWLLPNLHFLLGERLAQTTAQNIAREAPEVISPAGLIYYLRALASYYLMFPFVVISALGWWRYRPRLPGAWIAAGGALTLLTLAFIKDPRYAIPVAAPLALLVVAPWRSRRALAAVVGLAALQALLVSFSLTPAVHLGVGGRRPDPDYLNLTHEWVFFSSDYYGVMGPPGRGEWPLDELIERVGSEGRIAFAPERAFLHSGLISLEAVRRELDLEVARVGMTDRWRENLRESDWLVGATGPQGITYLTLYNEDVYEAVEDAGWPLAGEWELPDGTRLRLWRNPTRSR